MRWKKFRIWLARKLHFLSIRLRPSLTYEEVSDELVHYLSKNERVQFLITEMISRPPYISGRGDDGSHLQGLLDQRADADAAIIEEIKKEDYKKSNYWRQ